MHPVNLLKTVIACHVAVGLAGCASTKGAGTQTATILYSEGCVLYIDKFLTAQVGEFLRDWELEEECDIAVTTNLPMPERDPE